MSNPFILILYYSKNGSTAQLAQYIARGIGLVNGIDVRIRTVPEISFTCDAVEPKVPDQGAPYVSLDDLAECSGLALGSPTRFGNMAAPLKHFIDNTSSLWFKGSLINKPGCVFTSTSSMHGGQETTLTSMMLPLLHHGMLITGLPYSEEILSTTKSGGTPYGVTHVSGPEHRAELDNDEIILAKHMGTRLANIVLKLSQSC